MAKRLVNVAVRRAAQVVVAFWVCSVAAAVAEPADGVAPPDLLGDTGRGSSPDLPSLAEVKLPTVKLLFFDPTGVLPARATENLGQEVKAIFEGLGVDVAFAVAEPGDTYGDGPTLEVPVILLNDDPVPARRRQRVMGLVVRDQRPTHAVWAFLRNVRATLGVGRQMWQPVSSAEERDLGLALGRVVAHEVIHSIAPDEPHSRNGLMSHSLDRAFLVRRRADLDVRCGSAFLTRLKSLHAPAPGTIPPSALASSR